jgi:hypothetical protein
MPSHLLRRYKKKNRKARKQSSGGGGESRRSNPPLFSDLVESIGPGFGGFAASRFVSYVAATQIAQRWPAFGKHAGAVASIGSFVAAWTLAHKLKFLEKYHTPIVVGSGIAMLQTLLEQYIPRLGWAVGNPQAAIDEQQQQQQQQQAASGSATSGQMATSDFAGLPPGLTAVADVDPNDFVYDDRFDAGRMSPPKKVAQQPAAVDDDLVDMDDDLQAVGLA